MNLIVSIFGSFNIEDRGGKSFLFGDEWLPSPSVTLIWIIPHSTSRPYERGVRKMPHHSVPLDSPSIRIADATLRITSSWALVLFLGKMFLPPSQGDF